MLSCSFAMGRYAYGKEPQKEYSFGSRTLKNKIIEIERGEEMNPALRKLCWVFLPIIIVAETITIVAAGLTWWLFLWVPLVFVFVNGVFFVLGYEMVQNNMLLTRVQEARARNIEKSGTFWKVFWSFQGYAMLENGLILHQKHLYDARAAESSHAVMRDQPLLVANAAMKFSRGQEVSYSIDSVRRYPQKRIRVAVKIGENSDGNPIKKDVVLEMKDVFLDRNFNFMDTIGDDRSLEYLYDHVVGKPKDTTDCIYPDNFFDRIERGFYYKVTVDGTEYSEKLQIEDVIARVNVPKFMATKVKAVDHSDMQIWGGWHLMGFPWLYAPFKYHQAWVSLLPTGAEEATNTKATRSPLVDILLSDDIYLIPIKGAEDKRLLRLDIMLLIKLRIVDPRKAMYHTQKVLENVTAIAGSVYRRLVSQYTFEQIIGERNELGQSWWKLFLLEICDPVKEHFFERYGIWILSSDLWKVDVHGGDQYAGEIQRIQVLVFKAEQEKKARITEAAGKAEATRIYFQSIRDHGSDGLQILFMQTLQALGTKDGKMIIPFGDIGRFLSGTIGGDKESALFGALAAAGVTPDLIQDVMLKVNEAKASTPSKIVKAR